MRVLVTGGAGFIGSAFCRASIGRGWTILNLDKLTYAANLTSLTTIETSPRYRFVKGDIGDLTLMKKLLNEFKPNAVAHFAAESHVDRSIEGATSFIETNVRGTQTLLDASLAYWANLPTSEKPLFKFLHVSTDEVFGSIEEGFFSESTPYDPRSPYAASKAAADHLARAWNHTYGLPVIVSNCSNNYGPYQFPEKLIPLLTLNALEGRPLPVYGDGQNVRDWLFVDDHVVALHLMLEHGVIGETYCVGGRSALKNIDVVQDICDIVDEINPSKTKPCNTLIEFVKDRPGHDRRYAIDPTKIERDLGWRVHCDFKTGLRRTIEWYATRKDWWGPIRANAYRGQRLGLRAAE